MPLEPQEPFGFFVRRIRLENKMSQQDVERNGGPTQTTVSDYELSAETSHPKRPTPRMIMLFARGLGIDVAEVEKAAGLLPGSSRSVPIHDVPDALLKAGMRPAWLSTGDVIYLVSDDSDPDETLGLLEAYLEGLRQGRQSRDERRRRRGSVEPAQSASDPLSQTDS